MKDESRGAGEWLVLSHGVAVPAELHLPDLLPRPVGVELRGADEGEVDAERAVDARAVDADEHAVRDRGPRGVLAPAVEAHLSRRNKFD